MRQCHTPASVKQFIVENNTGVFVVADLSGAAAAEFVRRVNAMRPRGNARAYRVVVFYARRRPNVYTVGFIDGCARWAIVIPVGIFRLFFPKIQIDVEKT